jgi:hypothetical protein
LTTPLQDISYEDAIAEGSLDASRIKENFPPTGESARSLGAL